MPETQQAADLIGRTLARTYRVEKLLGRGGMGTVYAARHVRTAGLCALKVLHREAAADEEIYKRFQSEARIVSALRHPNIVQVTDFDQDDDGCPFIVMELLDGQDLNRHLRSAGRLPWNEVLDLMEQAGSALQAAHDNGVVHRDVKPHNILLVRHQFVEGTRDLVKVVDFGISKIRRPASQATANHTILGTPQFMSPEAAQGRIAEIDGRADQFALAVIAYRALSGRLPFRGSDPASVLYQVVHEEPVPLLQLVPELPGHVVAAVQTALAKRKEERFATVSDFVRALRAQPASGRDACPTEVAGQSVTLGPSLRLRPARRWLLPGAALLGGLLGLSAVLLLLWSNRSGSHLPAPKAAIVVPVPVPPKAAPLAPAPMVTPLKSAGPDDTGPDRQDRGRSQPGKKNKVRRRTQDDWRSRASKIDPGI